MEKQIDRVLLTEEQIQSRVRELAATISQEYQGKFPVFVGVLKGVVMFFSDFFKQVTIPCQMDFMCISSYSGTQSSGKYEVRMDVSADIRGRDVVILEDIFDTGRTLKFAYQHLMDMGAASVRIVTLLDKPSRRDANVTLKADYTGFVIEDEFVVGYGLDYNEQYRNLPYVGVLKPEAYL